MDLISFSGTIHYIQNDAELRAAIPKLSAAAKLGFDTETKPTFRKGDSHKVALLQLATETDAFVIRLHYVKDFALIKSIFEKTDITKIGVAIHDDLKGLQKLFPFNPHGFVDLQKIAKEKRLKNLGLKGMTEEVLGARLSKGPKLTNWEARELSESQIMYAATDAWIGLTLYNKLMS